MKRTIAISLSALVSAGALALTPLAPARADQMSVNKCGKTIAKENGKMLKLFEKSFLKCYTARHKCAALAGQARDDCLAATRVFPKPCSCEKLDVDNPNTGPGKGLLKLEAKIGTKCDPNQAPISLDELLYADPMGDPRRHLAFADKRNCMCEPLLGSPIDTYAEFVSCNRLLLIKAAASQVGWDADPRAQDEIFEIIVECAIGIDPDPCT